MRKRIHNDYYLQPEHRTVVCSCGKRYEIGIDEDEPEECPHFEEDESTILELRELRLMNEDDPRLTDR